jgi:hypothetical protein
MMKYATHALIGGIFKDENGLHEEYVLVTKAIDHNTNGYYSCYSVKYL